LYRGGLERFLKRFGKKRVEPVGHFLAANGELSGQIGKVQCPAGGGGTGGGRGDTKEDAAAVGASVDDAKTLLSADQIEIADEIFQID
jgi:hypothetical protein